MPACPNHGRHKGEQRSARPPIRPCAQNTLQQTNKQINNGLAREAWWGQHQKGLAAIIFQARVEPQLGIPRVWAVGTQDHCCATGDLFDFSQHLPVGMIHSGTFSLLYPLGVLQRDFHGQLALWVTFALWDWQFYGAEVKMVPLTCLGHRVGWGERAEKLD